MDGNNYSEEWLTTSEFAGRLRIKGETVRRSLCVNGHYLGVVPVKLPNQRLLWPSSKADKLLNQQSEEVT